MTWPTFASSLLISISCCGFFSLLRTERPTSGNLVGCDCVSQSVIDASEQTEGCIGPGEMAATQVHADPEKRETETNREMSPDRQMTLGGRGSGRTDGGVASVEDEAPEKVANMKLLSAGEQMESSSETTAGNR